ncbi:MAG TPA: DUF1638 domain-containing protein [Candidatus Hydrogenedentes bacterium]|nr:DUF1638 domain-containing protein [Candidatus Hydrogenedentota bacterium]
MLAEDLRKSVTDHMETSRSKRYCVIACHVLWREIAHFAAESENVFFFRFLKQGLHDTPDILRADLQKVIDEEDGKHDALLIGYGLCSNGIQGITARTTPLVCVCAHDCITFLLGSKERYREYFDSHPGTYWYSPGWIEDCPMPGQERYEAALKTYTELYGEESAKYLMEATETWIKNYGQACYVDLGIGGSESHREYTRRCALWLGWGYDNQRGDPELVRRWLNGEWDSEAFLVVRPGEVIAPSFDERVIEARPVNP